MWTKPKERIFHNFFTIGVWVKGIDGTLETVGGLLYLFVSQTTLSNFVFWLTRQELLEDPDDRIANGLRLTFSHLSSGAKLFVGAYLLTHGIVKLFLVAGLLRGKSWSYPVAIAVLAGFIFYQIYWLKLHFSPALLGLTIFDIIIVALIWRERRYVNSRSKLNLNK